MRAFGQSGPALPGRPTAAFLGLLVLCASVRSADPQPKASTEDVKGSAATVMDLTVTPIKLSADKLRPTMIWADKKGTALFVLEKTGMLRRINVPDFTVATELDVERKCSSLAMSAEGLLLAVADAQEVWVLDPEKLTVKRKIESPSVDYVASAPNLSFAFASAGKEGLTILDLKKGKATPFKPAGNVGSENPVATPDGAYLFTRGGIEQLHRFKIDKGTLKFEESSQRIAQGRISAGIQVSADSKYVCLPCGGGNYGDLKDHPKAAAYSTYVYPVKNINKPAFTLEQGAYPSAVGFDPAGKLVYSQNHEYPLITFGETGIKKKEYKMDQGRDVLQYLVHPDGRKLLLLSDKNLSWIELPEK